MFSLSQFGYQPKNIELNDAIITAVAIGKDILKKKHIIRSILHEHALSFITVVETRRPMLVIEHRRKEKFDLIIQRENGKIWIRKWIKKKEHIIIKKGK